MGLLSAQQVYDDPELWLSVLHEVHESLRNVMKCVFPDFESKLQGIHCLRCEGKKPLVVHTRDKFECKLGTGYIDQDEGGEPLLRLEDPGE